MFHYLYFLIANTIFPWYESQNNMWLTELFVLWDILYYHNIDMGAVILTQLVPQSKSKSSFIATGGITLTIASSLRLDNLMERLEPFTLGAIKPRSLFKHGNI